MEKFTVTIARGFGSGGRTIGKMLAEKLGVKFYDKELIRMASDASGINEALFGQSDEKTKNSVFGKPGVYRKVGVHFRGEPVQLSGYGDKADSF